MKKKVLLTFVRIFNFPVIQSFNVTWDLAYEFLSINLSESVVLEYLIILSVGITHLVLFWMLFKIYWLSVFVIDGCHRFRAN